MNPQHKYYMSNAGGNSLDDQYPGQYGAGMNMDDIDETQLEDRG
jgi:hypothetical protein